MRFFAQHWTDSVGFQHSWTPPSTGAEMTHQLSLSLYKQFGEFSFSNDNEAVHLWRFTFLK